MNKPHKPKAKKISKRKTNKTRATSQEPAVVNSSTHREDLHLKYPPQYGWENVSIKDSQEFRSLFLRAEELPEFEEFLLLSSAHIGWKRDQSPFNLLQMLLAAHRANVYPPISVLSALAKAAESFFIAEGNKRFDECLGLVGKRGERNFFTESTIRSRDAKLCQQMETLIGVWKVTIEEAAAIVAAANPHSLSEDTINRYYSNNKKWKELRTIFSTVGKVYSLCWSTEDRQNFLTSFPVDSLSPRIQSEHPLYNPEDPDS